MSKVFVLDAQKQPLAPCHKARARQLLTGGKAAVYRRFPFTIILKRAIPSSEIDPKRLRLKIDPGSRTTGIAIVNDQTGEILFAAELFHRGETIKRALYQRRAVRRGRRHRKTRYRQPRFNNRRRPSGWLPPSLMSRVHNIETWARRLRLLCPLRALSFELVRFDTQKLQNPEISGVEYQHGTLYGYEIWEYLLSKWGRKCVYCGAEDVPLQKEHMIPKSRGGSDRVSNLTVSCIECNQKKGNQTAEEFGFPSVMAQANKPLTDAAAINATRWEIYQRLLRVGLPVEVGTGGQTRFNRTQQGLPKTHWLDAACVGKSTPGGLQVKGIQPLTIRATGHGSRQMCRVDRFGFPRTLPKGPKKVHGFQTGDLVKASVPRGLKAGTYIGRVAVRSSGGFNIKIRCVTMQGIRWKYCRLLHQADGYTYQDERSAASSLP